jgi:hypothetical protein
LRKNAAFKKYELKFPTTSLLFTFDAEKAIEELQVELLDIQCDSILRQKFCEVPLLPNLTISAPLIR